MKHNIRFTYSTALIAISIAAFSAAPAIAQTAGAEATPEAADEVSDGNEIIVTAQKRNEALQDVPIAISAFSGDNLAQRGISSVVEIAHFTPGFTASSFSESEPIFAVRGANNTFSQAGVNKPVGVFVDDVYISRNSGSAFELYDIEQVAVLRGPQGTLFGRNVTGGAIVITTTRPSLSEVKAKAELGYGNYDAISLRGLVSAPLSETFAAKISGSYQKRDGYGRDRLSGAEQNDLNSLSLRGQLLFEPTPDLNALLTVDYSRDHNGGRTLTTTTPASADDGDIRTSEHGRKQRYRRETWGVTGHIDYKAAAGTFSSITAYRDTDSFEDLAFSPTSYTLLPPINAFSPFQQVAINQESPRTFSQELRYVSDFDGPFNIVVGAFYFHENIDRDARSLRYLARSGALLRDQNFDQDVTTKSYALYSDIKFEIVPTLALNLSGRYTWERKSAQVDFADALRPAIDYNSPVFKARYNEFTPRAALTWTPSRRFTAYASYTKGFTAGGFNTEEDTLSVVGTPFRPETVEAYEAGIKTSFLDGRVTANVAGFLQNYKDKQEGYLDPTFNFVIVNAARARMKGFEVELNGKLTDNLRLFANYAYLDARYRDFVLPGTLGDRTGNLLPTSPKNSLSLGAELRTPLGDWGDFFANASYSWQSDYYTGSENKPTFLIDSYDLADLSFGFEPQKGDWKVTLWMKNLTDKNYVLVRSDFGTGGIGDSYGAPRTYGVRLSWKLN